MRSQLVLSKQSTPLPESASFCPMHILLVFLVKDHIKMISVEHCSKYNFVPSWFATPKLLYVRTSFFVTVNLFTSQGFSISSFSTLQSCNPKILMDDLLEVFWCLKDTCCSRHRYQTMVERIAISSPDQPHFLHTENEVVNHVVVDNNNLCFSLRFVGKL